MHEVSAAMTYSTHQIDTQNELRGFLQRAHIANQMQCEQYGVEQYYRQELALLHEVRSRAQYAPSPLPKGFWDDWSRLNLIQSTFYECYDDVQFYVNEWRSLLQKNSTLPAEDCSCHARAYMRQWKYWSRYAFHQFIRHLPVYDDYLPEIANQYRHDKAFARLLAYMSDGTIWKDFFDAECAQI